MTRARSAAAAILLAGALALAVGAWWRRTAVDPSFLTVVQRGNLTSELTVLGTLRPIQSITYRSPVGGRELEIVSLVSEGSRVKEGDVLVQLDTTELERDVERQRQDLRQLRLDLQVAHGERQEAEAAVTMVSEGEGALSVEEARAALRLAEKKRDRLQQEYGELKPLLARGFITRSELARTASDLEQAEQELGLVRKRSEVVEQLTHPREKQRAALQLAQKNSQLENIVGRVQESEARLQALAALLDACRVVARRPGLVVYEQFLSGIPRRKIRIGDRVTASQGIVTIPEVSRMTVEASVTEAEVHRVRPGQAASVRVEAFPDLRLSGKVARVGTLASVSVERPMDEKRFEIVIELDASEDELRPEMTARADILVSRREDVLLVPVTAVTETDGVTSVAVLGVGGVSTRRVQLGESNGQMVEVQAGLRERERVVLETRPAQTEQPDSRVAPLAGDPGVRSVGQLR